MERLNGISPKDVVSALIMQTRIPPELEARWQREALDKIKRKHAEMQLGEDYPYNMQLRAVL